MLSWFDYLVFAPAMKWLQKKPKWNQPLHVAAQQQTNSPSNQNQEPELLYKIDL